MNSDKWRWAMTNTEQKRIFARNLDRLIVKSGHTRQEVADALGFNYKTFSGWCNGLSMPTAGKIQLIADFFHVGKSELLDAPNYELPVMVMTPEEIEFIHSYRNLDEYHRRVIQKMAATLAEESAQ